MRQFKKLHFRNATGGITNTYPLRVTAAPEPSNVIYENLAISRRQKCARRFISFIAMLVCSVVLLASSVLHELTHRLTTPPPGTADFIIRCNGGCTGSQGRLRR